MSAHHYVIFVIYRSGPRQKLNTLIVIDVHARDIVDRFVKDSILDANEFDWER